MSTGKRPIQKLPDLNIIKRYRLCDEYERRNNSTIWLIAVSEQRSFTKVLLKENLKDNKTWNKPAFWWAVLPVRSFSLISTVDIWITSVTPCEGVYALKKKKKRRRKKQAKHMGKRMLSPFAQLFSSFGFWLSFWTMIVYVQMPNHLGPVESTVILTHLTMSMEWLRHNVTACTLLALRIWNMSGRPCVMSSSVYSSSSMQINSLRIPWISGRRCWEKHVRKDSSHVCKVHGTPGQEVWMEQCKEKQKDIRYCGGEKKQ